MPYSVYRVPLSNDVWNDKKFKADNPNGDPNKSGASYIGTTGKTIDERFRNHKSGVKHNKYVKEYGKSIELVSEHPTWAEAHKKEIEVALEMKRKGVGVFQR